MRESSLGNNGFLFCFSLLLCLVLHRNSMMQVVLSLKTIIMIPSRSICSTSLLHSFNFVFWERSSSLLLFCQTFTHLQWCIWEEDKTQQVHILISKFPVLSLSLILFWLCYCQPFLLFIIFQLESLRVIVVLSTFAQLFVSSLIMISYHHCFDSTDYVCRVFFGWCLSSDCWH